MSKIGKLVIKPRERLEVDDIKPLLINLADIANQVTDTDDSQLTANNLHMIDIFARSTADMVNTGRVGFTTVMISVNEFIRHLLTDGLDDLDLDDDIDSSVMGDTETEEEAPASESEASGVEEVESDIEEVIVETVDSDEEDVDYDSDDDSLMEELRD
jgi:hypothetical protein